MAYTAESIARLKRAERFNAALHAEIGRINDLSRDEVVIDVGNPPGSISGWSGPLFWQVWVEYSDEPGKIRARIDRGEIQEWQFPSSWPEKDQLAAAQEQVITRTVERREALLAEAKERLQQLKDADG